MRKLNTALLLAIAVVTTACSDLLSLHALYTPEGQVFDSAPEGRWNAKTIASSCCARATAIGWLFTVLSW